MFDAEKNLVIPRVLLISPIPPPYGGIARWTSTMMAMGAKALGCDLKLINTAHRAQRSDETTLATRIVTGATQTVRVVGSIIWEVLRRERPDCVHINTSGSLGLIRDVVVLTLCRLLRVPSVLHLRFGRSPKLLNGRVESIEGQILRVALRLAGTTISIDNPTHAAVAAEVGFDRCVLIPNFIETELYEPRFYRPNRTVLFLGSAIRSKGVLELLEAWQSLALEGWSLRLVGPLSPSLQGRLAQLDSDPSVQVVGPVEHEAAMQHMYRATFMVLPSHTEGFPNVVLEAMATGTPVVASAVGAIPSILDDGAGVVVPPRDVEALKQAIRLLVEHPKVREVTARKALARLMERYSRETVTAQYRRVWSKTDWD